MNSSARHRAVTLGLLALLLALPAGVRAQAQPDPWEAARWRFGPLAVTPTFQLKNLGWDSNVFNETVDPNSDFTATAAMPIDWWLRFGRGRLHGVNYFEGVYFATYADQRSFNQRHELTLHVPFNRVRPYLGGYYLSTNERPGYEINTRIHHTELDANAGAIVRLTSRLDVDLSVRQLTYEYDDADDVGELYSTTLNHRAQNYGAQFRYQLTPLTTITLLADGVNERYSGSPDRDNRGFRILPGVEFDPDALIKGKAQIGYRKLDTLAPGMPDFSGLVASAELSYDLRGETRFTVGFSRDIYFSYEITEPFYVQPGFMLGITQHVAGPWDVQARGSWYRLNYQRSETAGDAASPERVDYYRTFGGGVGYRMGPDVRVGFNVDWVTRRSVVQLQDFEGLRGGVAVTYAPK